MSHFFGLSRHFPFYCPLSLEEPSVFFLAVLSGCTRKQQYTYSIRDELFLNKFIDWIYMDGWSTSSGFVSSMYGMVQYCSVNQSGNIDFKCVSITQTQTLTKTYAKHGVSQKAINTSLTIKRNISCSSQLFSFSMCEALDNFIIEQKNLSTTHSKSRQGPLNKCQVHMSL